MNRVGHLGKVRVSGSWFLYTTLTAFAPSATAETDARGNRYRKHARTSNGVGKTPGTATVPSRLFRRWHAAGSVQMMSDRLHRAVVSVISGAAKDMIARAMARLKRLIRRGDGL